MPTCLCIWCDNFSGQKGWREGNLEQSWFMRDLVQLINQNAHIKDLSAILYKVDAVKQSCCKKWIVSFINTIIIRYFRWSKKWKNVERMKRKRSPYTLPWEKIFTFCLVITSKRVLQLMALCVKKILLDVKCCFSAKGLNCSYTYGKYLLVQLLSDRHEHLTLLFVDLCTITNYPNAKSLKSNSM